MAHEEFDVKEMADVLTPIQDHRGRAWGEWST